MEEEDSKNQFVNSFLQSQKGSITLSSNQQTVLKCISKYCMSRQGTTPTFDVERASKQFINRLKKYWSQRVDPHPNVQLFLRITNPSEPISYYQKRLQPTPSVILEIDGVRLKNINGFHKCDNTLIWQGNQHMGMIYHTGTQSRYIGQFLQGKQHGNGIYFDLPNRKDSSIYRGEFSYGKKSGFGKLVYVNLLKEYQGQWSDNKQHGKGKETISHRVTKTNISSYIKVKSIYQGDFYNGKYHGQGIQKTSEGVYEGQWKEGCKNGFGKMIYKKKGDIYQGNWEDGVRQGEGIYTDKSGNTFKGTFKNGETFGKFVVNYFNNDVYEGELQACNKHGYGVYSFQNGDYYEGQWRKNFAQGKGTCFIDNVFYEGQFLGGLKHGIGEETTGDGPLIKGIWKNGKMIKKLQINGEPVPEEEQDQKQEQKGE